MLVPFFLAAAALTACSSASTTPANVAPPPAAFAAYCTGKLQKETPLLLPMGAGGWHGSGAVTAPAGSEFLLAAGFDNWEGYVILDGGGPAKLSADFRNGLINGTDFTSDCAPATAPTVSSRPPTVLLAKASFYASKDLSGPPCTLDAGTELTNSAFTTGGLSGENAATISSNEIAAKCKMTPAFSKDASFASLMRR